MISYAVLLPHPPLLIPGATGRPVAEVEELREAALKALRPIADGVADRVVLVGADPASRDASPDEDRLPLSLQVGRALLNQAEVPPGVVALRAISPGRHAGEYATIGETLAEVPQRIALVVMGDGSARRRPTSPGYVDHRAVPFDAQVEKALLSGDAAAVSALDPTLAADLLAGGWPAWQVLAGALPSLGSGTVHYSGDPFGVQYLVASWEPISWEPIAG